MKMKNRFVAAGIFAGLAIFSSNAALAAQTCLELPGELHLASVEGSKRGSEFGVEQDLMQDLRIRLNERAIAVCSGGEVCVESASIKTTFFFHPWTKVGHGSMAAVVNCLK